MMCVPRVALPLASPWGNSALAEFSSSRTDSSAGLKFFRHRTDAENRLERIIDLGAAELAFPKSVYGALVAGIAHCDLTWETLRLAHRRFAPSSSLLSAAKALVRFWPRPAFLLTAAPSKSKQRPYEAPSLRIRIEGVNDSARQSGVQFIPNMRVPKTSPLARTFASTVEQMEFENLATWTTSDGTRLPDRRVLTASIRLGPVAYAFISPI